MVVPTPKGEKNALVLAAAYVAGVTRAFTIGGAQAVAALAYGTATVPKVDKITGPGNAYVASAKRRVFGTVGIDMIAGPSEILVLADGTTPPDWVAMDLFSQAEHDELAQSILLCPDAAYIDAVQAPSTACCPPCRAPRSSPKASLNGGRADPHPQHGRGLRHQQPHRARAPGSEQQRPAPLGAAAAPRRRHLPGCLHQREPGRLLRRPQPRAAHQRHGALQSPLGVYDFQKRSSLIEVSEAGAQTLGQIAAVLAYGEGLQAHARRRRRCDVRMDAVPMTSPFLVAPNALDTAE
jgi:histidinol dehydrogenase